MDYLKFNCFDLAEQQKELMNIGSNLNSLSQELSAVLKALDPQIKSYEGIQISASAIETATANWGASIIATSFALDQIVDIYFAAEKNVLKSVEELPVEVLSLKARMPNFEYTVFGAPDVSAGVISSNELVIEDWLMNLVYRLDVGGTDT